MADDPGEALRLACEWLRKRERFSDKIVKVDFSEIEEFYDSMFSLK